MTRRSFLASLVAVAVVATIEGADELVVPP